MEGPELKVEDLRDGMNVIVRSVYWATVPRHVIIEKIIYPRDPRRPISVFAMEDSGQTSIYTVFEHNPSQSAKFYMDLKSENHLNEIKTRAQMKPTLSAIKYSPDIPGVEFTKAQENAMREHGFKAGRRKTRRSKKSRSTRRRRRR